MPKSRRPPRTEHERKFLVIVPRLPKNLPQPKMLVQGYLSYKPLQSRIRITDGVSALHEFKGKNDLEIPTGNISVEEAEFLLNHYGLGDRPEKARYRFPTGVRKIFREGERELVWELDIFSGRNAPLHFAELELPAPGTSIPDGIVPSWVGPEISGDARFRNRNLSRKPFDSWPKVQQKEVLKLMGL